MVEGIAASLESEPAFDDAPSWHGQPRETGPLARMAGHPLMVDAVGTFGQGVGARVIARLLETAAALEDLRTGSGARHRSGRRGEFGLGWAETSRGLLVHRTRVADGRLAQYRIVAPTEWNFHPEGAFARGTVGLADDGGLEAGAHWIVGSLDPCVGVRYEVARA
jgi:Ni,Fe-hydrogenase I large subunit